jgi:hypothetical protein
VTFVYIAWAGTVVLIVVLTVAIARMPRWSRPPREAKSAAGLDRFLRETVVVTLKTGAAFQGVLFEHDDRAWILREAHALAVQPDATNLPVDGEVVLLVGDIAYAQRP